MSVIRQCTEQDFDDIYSVINDGAWAFRDVIPADRWRNPYMRAEELRGEMEDGVVFWGYEEGGELLGVMGVQNLEDVTLIRHAYVRLEWQRHGIGSALLAFLKDKITRPCLVGTWASAEWAISFYEKHGFQLVSRDEKERLLRLYWKVPERQIQTSVVLADPNFRASGGLPAG